MQESAIDQYFSPLDKEAEMIMKVQLEGEERSMKEMVKTMQRQAILEKEEAERLSSVQDAEAKKNIEEKSSPKPPSVAE